MGLVNREATFKCKIVDHGLSRSSNSWPQWVAQLQAFEIYDEDEKVWVDWTDQEENQISTYMVLVGGKGETLGVSQLVAATGWDGSSFIELVDLTCQRLPFKLAWSFIPTMAKNHIRYPGWMLEMLHRAGRLRNSMLGV